MDAVRQARPRMREARIKVSPAAGEAMYHCMSQTVNGEWLFDDVAMEFLRRLIWQVADYCGVQVITHTEMVNHFHVVLRVPQTEAVSDVELVRRYRTLYPKPTRYQAARLEVILAELASNGPAAVAWRQRQLRLMGDVSQYMKLLKQRFSIWFNKTHRRFGTLWAERFKSVLVGPGALETMAAYIDLNCVRAGLVQDPKDYRFCGYAEAVAGEPAARRGLSRAIEGGGWDIVQSTYRERLFGVGGAPRADAASIPLREVERVMVAGGKLPLATVLRCRIRHFTDGAVLGTRAFVEAHLAECRRKFCRLERAAPQPLPPVTDWGDLAVLRRSRRGTIG
jgi:putative transposase